MNSLRTPQDRAEAVAVGQWSSEASGRARGGRGRANVWGFRAVDRTRSHFFTRAESKQGLIMPSKPPRPCRKPGCRVLSLDGSGYCETHLEVVRENQARRRELDDERRGSSASRGYGGHWQKVRDWKLKSDPVCERCDQRATLVHHLDGNQHNNAPENLQSLCRDCHERAHGRKR